jgi:hypothetical protein
VAPMERYKGEGADPALRAPTPFPPALRGEGGLGLVAGTQVSRAACSRPGGLGQRGGRQRCSWPHAEDRGQHGTIAWLLTFGRREGCAQSPPHSTLSSLSENDA